MVLEATHPERLRPWSKALLTHAGSFFSSALSSNAAVAPPFPIHAVPSGAQLRALRVLRPPPLWISISSVTRPTKPQRRD